MKSKATEQNNLFRDVIFVCCCMGSNESESAMDEKCEES